MLDLAAWRNLIDADPEAATPCLDWLEDQGTEMTLPRLLTLFAGQPKEYADGLHALALSEWCQRAEPGQMTGQVNILGLPVWRWEAVAAVEFDDKLYQRSFSMAGSADGDTALKTALAVAVRDYKRRILNLFPKVVCVERELEVHARDLCDYAGPFLRTALRRNGGKETMLGVLAQDCHDGLKQLRYRLIAAGLPQDTGLPISVRLVNGGQEFRFRQQVHAPSLIPPESAGYGPSPLVEYYRERRQ